jgi:hypothetical protein
MSGPRGRNDTGGSDESSEESDDGTNIAVLLKHLTPTCVMSRVFALLQCRTYPAPL